MGIIICQPMKQLRTVAMSADGQVNLDCETIDGVMSRCRKMLGAAMNLTCELYYHPGPQTKPFASDLERIDTLRSECQAVESMAVACLQSATVQHRRAIAQSLQHLPKAATLLSCTGAEIRNALALVLIDYERDLGSTLHRQSARLLRQAGFEGDIETLEY